jgi:acetoin utilization deacetylase AcuC-like enzyme
VADEQVAAASEVGATPNSERQAPLPTALVYDPAFLDHLVPDDFPEQPERLSRSMEIIEQALAARPEVAERVLRLSPRPATLDELTTVHEADYIELVRRTVERAMEGAGFEAAPRRLASEVYVSPGSYTAALLAAGAPLVALDAIGEGRVRNGYALVRPPGHHARPAQAMGFCIFNNVAVAARYAQRRWGWNNVLIVDYDVHHGNGTEEMFYSDPSVVYFSTHQFPLYPGTGASTDMGEGPGLGATINVPLPAESGWSVYDPIFRQVLWPVADRFRPDVILVSSGFDAHFRDPLSDMLLCNADFSDFTLEILEIADRYCDGRVVLVQEGGYDLDAVATCAATVLFALTGSDTVVGDLGSPPPTQGRWNDEAIVQALYQLHDLAGYRRKARRVHIRTDAKSGDN